MTDVVTGPSKAFGIATLMASSGSIQLQFAALQMAMAQANKEQAKAYMDEMTSNQNKIKECAEMISRARDLQQTTKADSSSVTMPADMQKYFTDRNLSWGSKDDKSHNTTEWEFNVKSLTNYQETLSNESQTHMVYIQDFMGQYNAYLTGANSAIQQANQTLSTIARGQ